MARILTPPSRSGRIKVTTTTSTPRDIGTALQELGIEPARITRDEVFALCPGHDDHSPTSWSVNRETGFHYCFSCNYSGSFLGLVMSITKLDPFAASRWVRTHGVELLDPRDIPRYEEIPAIKERRAAKEGQALTESSLALFYTPPIDQLEYRRINTDAAVRYDLLWDLENAGWIIPVRQPNGDLLGWQFKSNREFLNFPESMPKSTTIFGLDCAHADTAMLVESPLDAPRSMTAGLDPDEVAVVSSYGAEVSDDQMKLLMGRFNRVVLALDNDRAGRKATARLLHGAVKGYGRHEIKTRGYASRMNLFVYNYGNSEEKDPGDQTDDEVVRGYLTAVPAMSAGFNRVRVEVDVHRESETVSESSGRSRARPTPTTRRLPDGPRKDRRNNLRGRRAG